MRNVEKKTITKRLVSQSVSQLQRRTRHICASVQVAIPHQHNKMNTGFIAVVMSKVVIYKRKIAYRDMIQEERIGS